MGRFIISEEEKKHILGLYNLVEAYNDKFPKNQFVELSKDDLAGFEENIFDLIQTSYLGKGGNIEIKKPEDILNSDITYWVLNDINENPDADIAIGGKETPSGVKLTIMGQDGSKEAKRKVILKSIELMGTKGFYAELDSNLCEKMGLTPITDEKIIRQVLNKKIEMNDDGSYSRKIGEKFHNKVMVGFPNIN
jgi:hypothetical protein